MKPFLHAGLSATALLMLSGCSDGSGQSSRGASGQATDRARQQVGDEPAALPTGAMDAEAPPDEERPRPAAAVPGQQSASASATIAAEPPTAFLQCRSCHSVEPGRNGIGPSLAGIFGRPAASVPGFRYSPALKASGIVWSRDKLEEWLAAPARMVPGTRMVQSVGNDEQRRALVDYMEALD
jgi:cytochrome c